MISPYLFHKMAPERNVSGTLLDIFFLTLPTADWQIIYNVTLLT